MTRLEWLARNQHNGDTRAILYACNRKPRLDDLVTTETIERDAATVAKEQQLIGILDALGVTYSLPFAKGAADTIIPQIMQASAAATGDMRDTIQDNATIALTIWQGLGEGIYDEHIGQASYERERRTPQYGPSPAGEHSFEPYADVFEIQEELRQL